MCREREAPPRRTFVNNLPSPLLKRWRVARGHPRGHDGARLLSVGEAPSYLFREHIHDYYRVGGGYWSSLRGLFSLHNETGNAWTMIIGAVLSCAMMSQVCDVYDGRALPVQYLLLFLSVLIHMPFSTTLHMSIGISERTRMIWRTLDVFFIQANSVLIGIALALPVLEGFYLWAYCAGIVGVFARNVYSTMIRRRIWSIPKPQLAKDIRNLVVAYCLPVVIQSALDVGEGNLTSISHVLAILLCSTLVFGGYVYGKHLPERWFPGWLDLLWNSHQWMHLAAMFAHWLEW
eukprot:CAMPEP_0198365090 /NCGR_PEP_ID=MMETSP1450-20131203/153996_1 /TAXON_ID=753684 ORGANISM="Madagascaria erythrocladiodes, Strain CCMP3234" /NCGR_SAMPLE_ID=MMETSP1450 /ASSEMBLY_ACC=CAM_ASM_001115 /LENGTH=289 /DNA_ID=CAMNT_0044072533 /DNA_START=1065 /DNA_END=1931 /DNA_ORIENTATION=-